VTGPDHGGAAAWLFTRLAVFIAGGRAVRITPSQPRSLDGLHGLIIGGGADVDPQLYGEDPTPVLPHHKPPGESWPRFLLELLLFPLTWLLRKASGKYARAREGPAGPRRGDPARDALEMRLLDEAVRRGLPVLGICRGQQLLNVYFGGSLHQDLATFYVEVPATRTILPRKRVTLEPGSRLAALLGPDERVNALHSQGVNTLGKGVCVAARDRNGIVQGIEHETLPFVIGVQWHPEYLPQSPSQRAIFAALVREARAEMSSTAASSPPHRAATPHAGATRAGLASPATPRIPVG
jgi:putative glutamine amidotransferase